MAFLKTLSFSLLCVLAFFMAETGVYAGDRQQDSRSGTHEWAAKALENGDLTEKALALRFLYHQPVEPKRIVPQLAKGILYHVPDIPNSMEYGLIMIPERSFYFVFNGQQSDRLEGPELFMHLPPDRFSCFFYLDSNRWFWLERLALSDGHANRIGMMVKDLYESGGPRLAWPAACVSFYDAATHVLVNYQVATRDAGVDRIATAVLRSYYGRNESAEDAKITPGEALDSIRLLDALSRVELFRNQLVSKDVAPTIAAIVDHDPDVDDFSLLMRVYLECEFDRQRAVALLRRLFSFRDYRPGFYSTPPDQSVLFDNSSYTSRQVVDFMAEWKLHDEKVMPYLWAEVRAGERSNRWSEWEEEIPITARILAAFGRLAPMKEFDANLVRKVAEKKDAPAEVRCAAFFALLMHSKGRTPDDETAMLRCIDELAVPFYPDNVKFNWCLDLLGFLGRRGSFATEFLRKQIMAHGASDEFNQEIWGHALAALARIDDHQAAPFVCKGLLDARWRTRLWAARAASGMQRVDAQIESRLLVAAWNGQGPYGPLARREAIKSLTLVGKDRQRTLRTLRELSTLEGMTVAGIAAKLAERKLTADIAQGKETRE